LILLALLTATLYLKGLVRVSVVHMLASLIPRWYFSLCCSIEPGSRVPVADCDRGAMWPDVDKHLDAAIATARSGSAKVHHAGANTVGVFA
jgi:hypothetical protein